MSRLITINEEEAINKVRTGVYKPVFETVPCKYCDAPTISTGTNLCDSCWEFISRVSGFIARCNHAGLAYLTETVKEAKE